jgi:hypothetical protein
MQILHRCFLIMIKGYCTWFIKKNIRPYLVSPTVYDGSAVTVLVCVTACDIRVLVETKQMLVVTFLIYNFMWIKISIIQIIRCENIHNFLPCTAIGVIIEVSNILKKVAIKCYVRVYSFYLVIARCKWINVTRRPSF